MRIWKTSRLDALLVALVFGQLVVMAYFATSWHAHGPGARILGFVLLAAMMTYDAILLHVFAHGRWFVSERLNSIVSMLMAVNTALSPEEYAFLHVRNHHRFNNDRLAEDGTTKDFASTFYAGKDGGHASFIPYVLELGWLAFRNQAMSVAAVVRWWRVTERDDALLDLASKDPRRRTRELTQIQLDRAALTMGLCLFMALSWQWTLACYVPAAFVSFVMMAAQNYFEHAGTNPDVRCGSAVSCYSRVYNLLSFNDGYHQEHHLRPRLHWSKLPALRRKHAVRVELHARCVSKYPALLRFLDRARSTQLDTRAVAPYSKAGSLP